MIEEGMGHKEKSDLFAVTTRIQLSAILGQCSLLSQDISNH